MGHLCIKHLLIFILVKNPHHLDRAKIKGKTPWLSFPGALVEKKLGRIQAMALNLWTSSELCKR